MTEGKRLRTGAGLALSLLTLLLAGCGAGSAATSTSIASSPVASAASSPSAGQLSFKEIVSEPLGKDTIESLAFSPDGKHLAVGAADGVIGVYPLQSDDPNDEVRVQKLHAGFTSSIAWAPSGKQVLSAAADGGVRLWDPRTMQVAQSFNAYNATHPAAVWSPDGQKIAIAQGRDFIQVFDVNGSGNPQTLNLPGTTRALLWLPDGEIAGSDLKGRVAFFQLGKSDPVRAYQPATAHKAVNSLSLSPTDNLLAVGYDDGSIILIDPASAKEVRQLPNVRSIGNVAWSPNGKVLAVSSIQFALTFFDPQGKQLAKLDIGYDMNGVSWSPDGRYLASGSDDHTFKIWQVSPPQTPARQALTPPSYMGR